MRALPLAYTGDQMLTRLQCTAILGSRGRAVTVSWRGDVQEVALSPAHVLPALTVPPCQVPDWDLSPRVAALCD